MKCAQQRLRSACAFAQSDQSSLWSLWVAKDQMLLHADSEDWSDWVGAQADLSLRFVGFVVQWLIFSCFILKFSWKSKVMHCLFARKISNVKLYSRTFRLERSFRNFCDDFGMLVYFACCCYITLITNFLFQYFNIKGISRDLKDFDCYSVRSSNFSKTFRFHFVSFMKNCHYTFFFTNKSILLEW